MTSNQEYKYIEVPHNCIESVVEICPLCHDTKTVSVPSLCVKLEIDPSYRTECSKCKVWWYTHKKEFPIL